MLLSRWPIRASRVISLPKLGTVTHLNMDTGGTECVVDTPSGPLRVYSVHLSAVSTRERLLQIDRLLECHRHAQVNGGAWTGDGLLDDPTEVQHLSDQNWSNDEDLPPMPKETIVMGDFNSEPVSNE